MTASPSSPAPTTWSSPACAFGPSSTGTRIAAARSPSSARWTPTRTAWTDFWIGFLGCIAGITCLGAAITGWMITRALLWERVLLGIAAILLVAPELYSSLVGAALVVPVLLRQLRDRRVPALAPS